MDRALPHFVSGLTIDLESLTGFYDSLYHPNKPSLNNLSVHFSASAVRIDDGPSGLTGNAVIHKDGISSRELHSPPELSRTDNPIIIIYVGSVLLNENTDDSQRVAGELSIHLKHELVHYAQGPVSTREELKGRLQELATAGFTAIKGALQGENALDCYRATRYKLYRARFKEMESNAYQHSGQDIVGLGSVIVNPELLDQVKLYRRRRKVGENRRARQAHRELSLTPPKATS